MASHFDKQHEGLIFREGCMSMIGRTLGHYTVSTLIGRGGMGEVYQAKDQKLGRDVAIKVLPEEFGKDADRIARFQREAKLLASLNHPNIASIYGLEDSNGTQFLVMELIEGETLADKLKRGPIPVEEALKMVLQIAEALEAAHEKGVIHRDLKPANIKVTPDAKVKVLDFGLAKAFAGEQEVNLSNSPTLSEAATMQGLILGTAAYMSPEQARGKSVDKRTDIWAFGCVLYEMLTGQAAFQGEDVTEILAAVVKSGVNLDLLPANIHPRVQEILTRCLQKEPRKRYSSINDAQYEIERIQADPSGVFAPQIAAIKPRKKLRVGISWVAAALVLGAIISGVAVWKLQPAAPRPVVRLTHDLPEGQGFSTLYECVLAVSPDGRQIVYATSAGLYLRSVDVWDARLIAGTEGNPERPFFSPDGEWLGYWSGSENRLKKIAISGGAPLALTDAFSRNRYSWRADDTILFGQAGGIMRISANGGTPEPILTEKDEWLIVPQILPDGKSILYCQGTALPSYKVMLYSPQSGERKELFPGDTPRYLPSGHILYALDNNLLAVPFNVKTLQTIGGAVPVVENVVRSGGAPQYAISDSGTLAYLPATGADLSTNSTVVWVDRNGKEESLFASQNLVFHPRISPDGTRVAVAGYGGSGGGNVDVYVRDLARGTMTRLTFDPAEEDFPLWTPDGKRIAFCSWREDDYGIYLKSADGTGNEELILPLKDQIAFPGVWSGDGKTLLIEKLNGEIGALSMEGERKYKSLLQGKYINSQPRISPDGRWLAYTSNESGRNEIYVRPYPDVDGGKWQVSTSGGDSALWSPNGRELLYRNGEEIMAVPIIADKTYNAGSPKVLFRGTYVAASFVGGNRELSPWDINPDGKRFLMMKQGGSGTSAGGGPRRINIVLNWLEELKQRVPMK
jgi:Tol biopolymer transport system component/predicted Ser/Thr protein kinase